MHTDNLQIAFFNNPMVLMMIIMFGAMYFIVIRPQRKRQLEQDKLKASLKADDKIITIGGIHGTIESVKKDTVRIISADKSVIDISLESVMKRVSETDENSKK